MKSSTKNLIRWTIYGLILAGGMWLISSLFKGCQPQYTEPEVIQQNPE